MRFTDNRDVLASSGRKLRISFEGVPGHTFYDPCTPKDFYAATTSIADRVLDVGVFQSYPAGATPAPSCFIAGTQNQWLLDVDLGATFTGYAWRDLYGPYLYFMTPPPGLVELTSLPPGWDLRDGGGVGATAGGTWSRSYSPDPGPQDPTKALYFVQAFDGPVPAMFLGGSESQRVKVGEVDATLYRYSMPQPESLPPGPTILASPGPDRSRSEAELSAASPMLTLVWRLGDDDLALVAPEQYFSADALIKLAASAKPS